MVWQRAGTVAVQTGSTTVVGTNLDFAASSRNGDSFVGPDGSTYEVANVASSTVISILPPYKGPTVSGAAYAIMPVQGYDKKLSDAFNALNNQFGAKLAALGTTGNYEVLPLEKGGTGGSTKEEAQAALEIPTDGAPLSIARGGTGSSTGVPTLVGATSTAAGTKGLVPAPAKLGIGPKFLADSGEFRAVASATARICFNGFGGITIFDSFNVASVTKIGTGDYEINFASAMTNADFTISACASNDGGAPIPVIYEVGVDGSGRTLSKVRIACNSAGLGNRDSSRISVTIFGGKA